VGSGLPLSLEPKDLHFDDLPLLLMNFVRADERLTWTIMPTRIA